MRRVVVACWLGLAGIPAAARADVFAYEQDNGTKAFTDKLERVPEKYQGQVERRDDPKLFEYPRTTIVAVKAKAPKVRAAEAARVAFDAGDARTRAERAPRQALVEVTPGLTIPVDVEDESPLRVERKYRWIGGRYAQVVVVRQGDRVLAEIETAERF